MMNSGGLHIIWNLSGAQEIQIPDLTPATPDAAVRCGCGTVAGKMCGEGVAAWWDFFWIFYNF